MNKTNDSESRIPGLSVLLLYIFSFWGFVVAQPIYADLFLDGGFFRRHQNTFSDIWIAVLVLSFLAPGLISLCLWLLSRMFPLTARRLCYFLISLLMGGFCLLFLTGLPDMPFLLKGLIGLICGSWLTRILLRSKEREFLLVFFAAGALIFPVWYWLTSPLTSPFQAVSQMDLPKNQVYTPAHVPVVMIIFDELPLTSLLKQEGQIDADRFPNFAALARNATWFPNTVTVHAITRGAVPAILTGRYPPKSLKWSSLLSGHYERECKTPLPTVRNFPDTFFTLLENEYILQIFESKIFLCENSSCRKHQLAQSARQRIIRMFNNIAEMYFFRILVNSKDFYNFDPKYVHSDPASAKNTVKDSPVSHDYDIDLFHQLMQTIHQPGNQEQKPTLYFFHPILPHSPWEYDPSGKRHSAWNIEDHTDDVLCREAPSLLSCKNSAVSRPLYERHLRQVGYVDRLLGQIIAKLKETHLYDRALIVVTADHGISFMPGELRRRISANNYADIMSIPLFIKKPGQVIGKKDEQQVETVDIVPTIAGQLHLPLDWHTDGRDLFRSVKVDRTRHSICSPEIELTFNAKQIQAAKRRSLQQKQVLFP